MTVERSEVITYSSPKPTISIQNSLKHNLNSNNNTLRSISQNLQSEKISINDSSSCETTFYNKDNNDDDDDDKFFGLYIF